jgi:chaperonin cofactor prefoldin
MTPAKSTTKNELVEFDLEKIRRFTEQELERLANNPLPFCYQIGADVLMVGKYKVIKINDKCWQVTQQNQQIFDFFSRKDAIFYCIAMHKKNLDLANSIKNNDSTLGKLESDAIMYRYRYKKAHASNNDWEIELYSNRYEDTMAKIEQVKKELQKSINSAKYIKV